MYVIIIFLLLKRMTDAGYLIPSKSIKIVLHLVPVFPLNNMKECMFRSPRDLESHPLALHPIIKAL